MSKHHANALIALGIAVCTGFLFTPAIADPGYGLAALESGELLPFSPGDLLAAGNSLKVPDTPAPEPSPGIEETPEPSPGTGEEDVTPVTPESSETSAPPPLTLADAAPPAWTSHYDDEQLAALINTASIRLMKLSMEHAHALYLQDTDAASVAVDDLYALSTRLIGEAQPLQVSPGQQPIKEEFIRLLETYSTTSRNLLNTPESMPTAFREFVEASERLEALDLQVGAPLMSTAATSTLAAIPVTGVGGRIGASHVTVRDTVSPGAPHL